MKVYFYIRAACVSYSIDGASLSKTYIHKPGADLKVCEMSTDKRLQSSDLRLRCLGILDERRLASRF